MSDIVDLPVWLREQAAKHEYAQNYADHWLDCDRLREAAGEIERLRREVDSLRSFINGVAKNCEGAYIISCATVKT